MWVGGSGGVVTIVQVPVDDVALTGQLNTRTTATHVSVATLGHHLSK